MNKILIYEELQMNILIKQITYIIAVCSAYNLSTTTRKIVLIANIRLLDELLNLANSAYGLTDTLYDPDTLYDAA